MEEHGTIWASVTRGWCVSTRTQQLTGQTQSAQGSVKRVRLKFITSISIKQVECP